MIPRLLAAAAFASGTVDAPLAALAEEQGLAPRLGSLVAAGALACTDDVRARLTRAYRECAARNLAAEAIAARYVDATRAVYLKGAALIRSVYKDPGARAMSDVDVLVRDLDRAVEIGEKLGGEISWPSARPILRRFIHEVDVVFERRVSVDVHGGIAAWPLFGDARGIFRRAIGNVPAPADLFVTLAINAAQDGYVIPARAIVDGILLGRSVDPAEVRERARELAAGRATELWSGILADPERGVWVPRRDRSWTLAEKRRARIGLARATGWRFGVYAATRVADRLINRAR
jgi:hypothetical protein